MKTRLNSNKNFFLSLLLFVCLVFMFSIALLPNFVGAMASNYVYSDYDTISFKNGTFSSYTTGTKGVPYSIKEGWTFVGDSNISRGIIDVSESKFDTNNKFGLSSNPNRSDSIDSTTDYYILMFNAGQTSSNSGAKSADVTLTNAKFYDISVYAKSLDDGIASISANIDGYTYEFNNLTYTNWREYHFLIATDNIDSAVTNLTLRLGGGATAKSTGSVFFDNIRVAEISNYDFYSATESDTIKKIDLNRTTITGFTNPNFESGLDGWKVDSVVGSSNQSVEVLDTATINTKISQLFENNENNANTFVYGNTSSLLIVNQDETTSSISTNDTNFLTIPQHGLYKITLLFKTGNLSNNGLTFTLTPENDQVDALEVTNQKSTSGLKNYNGFSQLSLFVKGSPIQDEKVSLKISLGETSGWAIIDDITVMPVTASEYGSSNSLDFSSTITDTTTISNGRFDFADNQSLTVSYPLKPKSWTYTASNYNANSGIIRINPTYFTTDSANYGNPTNPGVNTAIYNNIPVDANYFNENVLMVRNNSSEDSFYTMNDSITLSANSASSQKIINISVCVKTLDNAKALIRVVDSNNKVVAMFDNISTNNQWTMYNIFVKNGINEYKLKLEIGAKGQNGNDFVFFDGISYTSESASTFDEMTKEKCAYVDLMNNSFYSSTNFSSYSSPDSSYNYSNISSISTRPEATDNFVLKLSNTTDTYQTLISDFTYSLTKDNYYEFSVWVKTDFTTDGGHNNNEFGARFEIVNVDSENNVIVDEKNENKNVFCNIKATDIKNENNGWVKYSFYIFAESSQKVKVVLGVGSEENLTYGNAYFDDLVVSDITKDVYTSQTTNQTTIVSTVIEKDSPEEDDEENNTTTSPADINIWALVSSIILVVALILAIIGYYIRRIPKKKKVKVKSSEYNKSKYDIDEDEIVENLKLEREASLSQLNKDLQEYNSQYEALKNEYDEKTKDQEVVDQKLYADYTKKANVLLEKIEYINSAIAYLNDVSNIRLRENKEINKKRKELQEKNEHLNSNEVVEQQEEVEDAKSTKTKRKIKKL